MLTSCLVWVLFPPALLECETLAFAAYAAVTAFGDNFSVDASIQACEDYDGLGGESACPEPNPLIVYVDASYPIFPI